MKKIIAMLLLLSLIITSAFAVVNNQTVYSVTDEVFSNIETLYIASGYGLPSSSGPWTGSELLLMMEKIDRDSLARSYQALYDSVMAKLNRKADFEFDTVSLDFGLEVNPEMYYRLYAAKNADVYIEALTTDISKLAENVSAAVTNGSSVSTEGLSKWTTKFVNSVYIDDVVASLKSDPKQDVDTLLLQSYSKFIGLGDMGYLDNLYNGSSEWFHGEDSRNPLLNITFETWATDHFYGYFELSLRDSPWKYLYQKNFNANINAFLEVNAGSNDLIPSELKPLQRLALISWQFPQKAVVSAGGKNWSIIGGRDKLSWGSGATGNLMLSKHFDNHTFAQFTTFHNNFNYTLLGTYYPFYDEVYSGVYSHSQDSDNLKKDGFKGLLAHRLEYSMFKKKVNLSVTEAVMIKKLNDDPFELAMINPFGFMHNDYARRNTNSILVFEADYTPIKHVNVYGQFALDDFSVQADDSAVPTATGFLVGVKSTIPAGPGIFKFNAEFVKTDPFLYLRGIYTDADATKQYSDYTYKAGSLISYGSGFDAQTRLFTNYCGTVYTNDFITYTYGNDKIVIFAGIDYEIPQKWDFSTKYYRIVSGVMNIYSPWGENASNGKNNIGVSTPSTIDPFYNGKTTDENYNGYKTGAVEYENVVSLEATWHTPVKGLSVSALADIISITNWNNKEGAKFNDLQATFGVKYVL